MGLTPEPDYGVCTKISETLSGLCPAFTDKGNKSGDWRYTSCSALIDEGATCECVWQKKSSCFIGHWRQLDFLDSAKARRKRHADEMVKRVRMAQLK